MYPTSMTEAIRSVKSRDDEPLPPLRFRSLLWRSALLNAAIVLTALPVMISAGGPDVVVASIVVLAAISLVIWVATLVIYSLVTMIRILLRLRLRKRTPSHPLVNMEVSGGLADEYLDGVI